MLAQQQHIWLGQRYFARWINVGPTLTANQNPTKRQLSPNIAPTITNHKPTLCQPSPNNVPTINHIRQRLANYKPALRQP